MSLSIIVPLDGSSSSERAVPLGATLARRSGGSIVLVTGSEAGVPADVDAYLDDEARHFGIVATHRIADSKNFPQSLADAAAAHPDPVIVMTSRGPTGLDDVVIGSVTAETLRATDAPVVLIGPHVPNVSPSDNQPYETLIVCLDGSPEAEAVVPVAARWARILGLTVWVIEVVEQKDVEHADLASGEHLVDSSYVSRIAAAWPPGGGETEFEVVHAHSVANAILDVATRLPRPMIAMATHGRTGLRRLIAGSVTMAVVRHATCPVLVTRPPAHHE